MIRIPYMNPSVRPAACALGQQNRANILYNVYHVPVIAMVIAPLDRPEPPEKRLP